MHKKQPIYTARNVQKKLDSGLVRRSVWVHNENEPLLRSISIALKENDPKKVGKLSDVMEGI